MGNLEEAVQIYQHSKPLISRLSGFPYRSLSIVIACDPEQTDAKMKLAELYETMNEPRKALSLVYEGNYYSNPVYSIKR
jgi:hypothetical protein